MQRSYLETRSQAQIAAVAVNVIDPTEEKDSVALIDSLCKSLFVAGTADRLRTRAVLCNIYHNALHDHWFKARDLMLMSHLQESISNSDVLTQARRPQLLAMV